MYCVVVKAVDVDVIDSVYLDVCTFDRPTKMGTLSFLGLGFSGSRVGLVILPSLAE